MSTLTINTGALAAAVKRATKIAGRTSTMPILEHIALRSEGGQLHITANDTLRCVSESIECVGDITAGCVQARAFNAALQNLRTDTVTLSSDDIGELTLRAGRSKLKLKTLPYTEFPQPKLGEQTTLSCTPADLAKAVSTVKYAAANDDVRKMLNGVFIDGEYAVGADGHRLAYTELASGNHEPIIIPIASTADIVERASGTTAAVTENQLIIYSNNGWYCTQLLAEQYIGWRNALPRESGRESITTNTQELIAAIRTASSIATALADKYMACKLTPGNEQLTLEGRDTETAINAEGASNLEMIAANAHYLIDAISANGEEQTSIEWMPGQATSNIRIGNNIISPMRI